MTAATQSRAWPSRAWAVEEIIQSSAMDCGPAALSALLGGHGIRADYARLREACQTDVDGTSIDVLEDVVNRLGLAAEQVMLPPDRLFGDTTVSLPAIAVLRLPDGAPHFVVVWRRVGGWLQVMDPADGRRWLHRDKLLPRLLRHRMSVPAADWRDWATGDEGLAPLLHRLQALGLSRAKAEEALAPVLADPMWFPLAAAEAALRLVEALIRDRALGPGPAALRLWQALLDQTCAQEDDIHALIPPAFWSVFPDPDSLRHGERRLILEGAVLLRVTGPGRSDAAADLPPDLAAALSKPGPAAPRMLWQMLRRDGLTAPVILLMATALALPATLAEAALLRLLTGGGPGTGAALADPASRLTFLLGVLGLMAVLLALRLPIGAETLRLGRRLDLQLRLALLDRIPRLTERFQSSRPVSDLADRAQSLHLMRQLPGMALHLVQSVATLALTGAGLAWLDPQATPLVLTAAAVALGFPFLAGRGLAEGEMALRVRGAALAGVWFDALRGQAALRAHHAQSAMLARHEGLLTGWLSAARRLSDRSALLALLRQSVLLGLIIALILSHAGRQGLDLLFLWWAFKLPDAGNEVARLIRQLPAQRAILTRVMEPLTAPERPMPERPMPERPASHAVALELRGAQVLAGGHRVLSGIDLALRPGEHVAVVGRSGSGKSSLLGLFLGFTTLSGGEFRLDGQPADEAALAALRRNTAWVDPGVHLWNDSFAANADAALPRSAEDKAGQGRAGRAAVAAALAAAGLGARMARNPAGAEAGIGDGGALLSGGEGQRLRLARAFAQEGVRMALLDEPFRGLDRATRRALLGQARRHWRDATLVWVTHDLDEVAGFDRVLVMEDGCILQDGHPAELARQPGGYAALAHADHEAAERLWGGTAWRRLWLEDGHVSARD